MGARPSWEVKPARQSQDKQKIQPGTGTSKTAQTRADGRGWSSNAAPGAELLGQRPQITRLAAPSHTTLLTAV